MPDWEDISRNAKSHGDFAGRTSAEQDAYFEFFAGSERSGLEAIFLTVRQVFATAKNFGTVRGLRWPNVGVSSSDSTTSP